MGIKNFIKIYPLANVECLRYINYRLFFFVLNKLYFKGMNIF